MNGPLATIALATGFLMMSTIGLHTTDAHAFQSGTHELSTDRVDRADATQFRMESGSRIWIEGSTQLAGFGCDASSLQLGSAQMGADGLDARLSVPVTSLECGKSRMNRDLQKAMKADEHPEIQYRLIDASASGEDSAGKNTAVVAKGLLTIAGVEREVSLLALATELSQGSYRVSGKLPLEMTDFDITPPRPLHGLIRVRDEIVVHFDLLLSANNEIN